jgi:putative tricarboxylic transport membrane protein
MRKARDPQPLAEARGPAARLTTRTVFLAVLALVLAAYTVLAMDLAWRSQSGQLGPGFFPRIIGVIGVALCLAALAKSLRTKAGGEVGGEVDGDIDGDIDGDVDVEPELGRHPGILTVVVLACVAFYFLLVPFGG